MEKVNSDLAFTLGLFVLGIICCVVLASSNDEFLHKDDYELIYEIDDDLYLQYDKSNNKVVISYIEYYSSGASQKRVGLPFTFDASTGNLLSSDF